MLPNMPENKGVNIERIFFSDEALYAFPLLEVNQLSIFPDYEQTPELLKSGWYPNIEFVDSFYCCRKRHN